MKKIFEFQPNLSQWLIYVSMGESKIKKQQQFVFD